MFRQEKYMCLSDINIPAAILSKAAQRKSQSVSTSEAVQRIAAIASFFSSGYAVVLTGAGVGIDSDLEAYRGKDGRYTNPNYKCAHHPTADWLPFPKV
jgi:NAD-dependent deacetylase sirtuin 4